MGCLFENGSVARQNGESFCMSAGGIISAREKPFLVVSELLNDQEKASQSCRSAEKTGTAAVRKTLDPGGGGVLSGILKDTDRAATSDVTPRG